MITTRIKLVLVFLLLALSMYGCSISHGMFSIASNKVLQLKNYDSKYSCHEKNIEGKDVTRFILGIPLSKLPTIDGAINNALQKGEGDYMENVTLDHWWWTIFVYGEMGWTAKGDVVSITRKCPH